MLWKRVAAVLLLAAGRTTLAQRSGDESICDYYAAQRYGESNVTTQLLLVQSIVTLAYAGSHNLLTGANNGTTGIFNEGSYKGVDVYLRPWFDGSKATTNLNNQPVGIDWLDGGATGPLLSFLNGSTSSVEIDKTTNQYRLFTHWFTAFGFVYGCSLAPKFPRTGESGGPLSPAYVHKFMDLNQTHIGYFVEQLTLASMVYGFSYDDAQTLSTYMNARYNVRCAPAINGQLFSICFADECPLAQPKPDCDAYKEIGPSGTGKGSEPTATAGPGSATSSAATTSNTPGPTTAAAGDAGSSETNKSDSAALSGGAIAGIAIGGAAVLLLAVGLMLYFRRRSAKPQLVPVPVPSDGYGSPAHPTYSYYSSNPHMSMASTIPHEAYMGGHNTTSGFWAQAQPKPQEMAQGGHESMAVPRPATMSPQIAEMESP